jgi:iron complex transport system permease protein
MILVACAALAGGTLLLGLLAGHTWLRTGDIGLWLSGQGPPLVRFALDERAPRAVAAMMAGGAIALAGTLTQATCRNPLAEPGLLGIIAGAGLGAVIVVTGGSMGRANPWDTPRIYTWLSGTTYGRTWEQIVPVAVALALALPASLAMRRELDLVALDEDTPRLVGVRLERTRMVVLGLAAMLAATAVAAVGVVGFLGLVAPHAARALVGGRHARVIPVAVLLGAILLGLADALGRTVIAPAQIPAGLVVALIGAPYFVYLLARSRG